MSGSNAANFTVIPYRDTLCISIGAARNVIPDAARLAGFAQLSCEDLSRCTIRAAAQT